MAKRAFRVETDSMGEVRVPAGALFGAQTQRAVENFPLSGLVFGRSFIQALGLIKAACAKTNAELGLMSKKTAAAIRQAAVDVAEGEFDDHFPVDVFQTGSGTSTNMNANEVIASLASARLKTPVHPNDEVNMGQSSNDVIPTAIHVSAALQVSTALIPSLRFLERIIKMKAKSVDKAVKTGRTHLMDAVPIRMSQELSAWAAQIDDGIARLMGTLPRVTELAIGGTAVGTGLNTPKSFGAKVARELARQTGIKFRAARNRFEKMASQDAAVELSGQLRTVAVSLMKISNDLRWMNSGPQAGLGEIRLPALQPGSSIMPGKVNPVIPEAAAMACAQVMGNDVTIAVAGQSGNFQLNVMLPVIAHNLLESIELLANAAGVLGDRAIRGFTVNAKRLQELSGKNPILVTSLNPVIGYDLAAKVAKKAAAEGRPVREVAAEMTGLSPKKLERLLDPAMLTEGGLRLKKNR